MSKDEKAAKVKKIKGLKRQRFTFKIPNPLDALDAFIDSAIIALVSDARDGQAKLDQVIDDSARWLDNIIEWPKLPGILAGLSLIAEALDGPIFRTFIGAHVQRRYDLLKIAGKV